MRKKLKTPNHKHAPFAVKTFLSHSPPFIDFQISNDKPRSSPLDRINKLTVGIIYEVHSAELLRAHSGERWCRNRPPSTPLPHPAASLCALSAHTLYKAGEVLTFPIKQNKGTDEILKTPISYICSADRDCASYVSVKQEPHRREGITPPLPQPYGQYHNTTSPVKLSICFEDFN